MQKVIFLPQKQQQHIKEYMPKQETIEKLAEFFSVFSDATRVKILTALCLSEMCVSDLSLLLNLNQTTVSHQLKFLKQNNAVKSKRNGKIIFYSLANECINDVMLNGVDYLLENCI